MLSAAGKFVKTVVPAVIRPMRVLWNEMIGFVFLVFAVLAGGSAFRAWRQFDGSSDTVMRMLLAGFFSLVMAYFGVASFFRARKINRQS
jgi:tryptophan-rich sensory protein